MAEVLPTRTTSWRPRFSLLSALLLMTVVGLAIVTAQLWWEIGPLRAEVHRLRDEVGVLSIDDPTKLCAIRVRTAEDYTWKWRIWIPEGRKYALMYSGESIPKTGIPKANGYTTLSQSGEMWIEYRIKPEVGTKRWAATLETSQGSVGGASQVWVNWKQRTSSDGGVYDTTKAFEPDKLTVLARWRVSQTAKSSDKIEDPSAGFMIWLEPTP
jgi:hypothetical protein